MIRRDFVTSASYNKALTEKERRFGDQTSTQQDSYKHHDCDQSLTSAFQREKKEYVANKSRDATSGEWWNNRNEVEPNLSSYATNYNKDAHASTSDEWARHRRKKLGESTTAPDATERYYNILTGTETVVPAAEATRSAKRISAERINSWEQGAPQSRGYNIISNLDA
ncbi:hypothetical protein HDV00_010869 [Rhizophlyctis rosea]|nr:hypothetical protein HDV00_010869 [Rhizophlyctis rosea]